MKEHENYLINIKKGYSTDLIVEKDDKDLLELNNLFLKKLIENHKNYIEKKSPIRI